MTGSFTVGFEAAASTWQKHHLEKQWIHPALNQNSGWWRRYDGAGFVLVELLWLSLLPTEHHLKATPQSVLLLTGSISFTTAVNPSFKSYFQQDDAQSHKTRISRDKEM